jgi:ribosome-binding protein aMBF1 (putative translation factor)
MRAARAFLRWSADDLAKAANVGVATIRRAEAEDGVPNLLVNNMEAIRHALEKAGVEFINGDAPGVKVPRKEKTNTPISTRKQDD